MANAARQAPSRLALATTVALGILLAGVGTMGWRWYSYVTAGPSPYDEVNRRLPESLRTWGCERIRERFPRTVPPYGCQPGQI